MSLQPRTEKYGQLNAKQFGNLVFSKLAPTLPYFMYVPRDYSEASTYNVGFSIRDLMDVSVTGVITARDSLAVDFSSAELEVKLKSFGDPKLTDTAAQMKLFGSLKKDMTGNGRTWNISNARQFSRASNIGEYFERYAYRPFDERRICYSDAIVDWPRTVLKQNLGNKQNLSMVVCRQSIGDVWANVLTTTLIGDDSFVSNRSKERGYYFPLYLYPHEQDLDQTRRVNFDPKIHSAIVAAATDKKHGKPDEVAIFDYIYGVLHCPAYRETYKEFLKIDFPRVPYPTSPQVFWDVSTKGTELRKLHLMEGLAIGATPYKFTGNGDSVVAKISYEGGVVRINATQGFEGVPEIAWNFYIGGYQPAQKWLKDRKTRTLSFDDIRHYQKIIKILSETDRIMKTIEMAL